MTRSSIFALLAGASLLLPGAVSAQVFSGSGTGAIPDGGLNGPAAWGQPLNVTFNVSGLSAPVADVSLSITMNHRYAGDVEAVLISPTGSEFVIFSRVGAQANWSPLGSPGTYGFFPAIGPGESFTYVFSDSASGDLWSAAGFDTAAGFPTFAGVSDIAAGSYRTSVAGPWDVEGNPDNGNHNAGQFTSFANSGFVGLTPGQANGTWTLRLRDGAQLDTGTVTAADLSIIAVPEPFHYALVTGLGLMAFVAHRRYSRAKA